MKRAIVTALAAVLSCSTISFAQQTVSSAGSNATGSGGTSSFTIGQVDYTSVAGPQGSVYQGVQQPYEIFTVGIDENQRINLELSVFPNPVSSHVTLRVEGAETDNLSYQLYDLYGRLLFEEKINQKETLIPMLGLRPSTYLLRVSCESEIQLFKVVKNQ